MENYNNQEGKQNPNDCKHYCDEIYNSWMNWALRRVLETSDMSGCSKFVRKV